MREDPLEILLIEDNPGDARLVQEMIESASPLEGRFDREVGIAASSTEDSARERGGRAGVTPSLTHVDSLDAGIEAVERADIDVILLDLNLPASAGLETLDAMLDAVSSVPIVVLTGLQDGTLGLEALDHGAQDYLVKDEINADLLIRTVYHAIQRAEYERLLQRQHDRLATLYNISETAQHIAGSLIDFATREEIESHLCSELAASGEYQFAWLGAIDRESGTLSTRAAAVPDGFFDELALTLEEGEQGPVGGAARSQETRVHRDPRTADASEVSAHANTYGYRAVAAIPISHEGAMYGVLAVYTDRSTAFEDEEIDILAQLGNVIGHAIAAVERKAALMNETAVQLDLVVPDFIPEGTGAVGEIEFLSTVPAGDGEYLQYASVEADETTDLAPVLSQIPEFHNLRVVDEASGNELLEISYEGPPLVSTLAGYGGHVRTATLVDGDFRVTIDLPADADVRSFVESIRESASDIDLVAQRSVESTPTAGRSGLIAEEASLTDKQRQTIKAAYFAGYFEQPRQSTGEEIAESLDITASTFHQHLQAGLRNLLSSAFDEAEQPVQVRD